MKRKIFSILFALVLVLSFSLVAAVPVGAALEDAKIPDDGATGVPIDAPVQAIWSEPVLLLDAGLITMVGSVSGDLLTGVEIEPLGESGYESYGTDMTLLHNGFAFGEVVTVTLQEGCVRDRAGNHNPDLSWSFTVEAHGDVTMTATSEEAFIGISVSPTFIDFGPITSGAVVSGDALTVSNTGNVPIMVDAEITADTYFNKEGTKWFYTAALRLSGCPSDEAGTPTSLGSWTLIRAEDGPLGDQPMWVNESRPLDTRLECPQVIKAATTYTGTVVFWAEQAGP